MRHMPTTLQALFSAGDLDQTFANLAASMSNAICDGADAGENARVTGKKGILTNFYRIQWPWITLHCILLSSGVVFFGLTLFWNQSAPVWKSNSLAVLNRGHLVQDAPQGEQTLKKMEGRAKHARLALYSSVKVDNLEYDPLETASD